MIAVTVSTALFLIFVIAVSALTVRLHYQVQATEAALSQARISQENESRQHQDAVHQREAAELSARQAGYNASRYEAQYLIEQKFLDQALVAAGKAHSLGGGWTDGLLINQIVNQCRQTWDLEHRFTAPFPVSVAAFADTPTKELLLFSDGFSIVSYDLNDAKQVKRSRLDLPVRRFIPFPGNSRLIVVDHQSAISVLSLDDLSVVARRSFGHDRTVAIATAETQIAVTLTSDNIQVFSSDLHPLDQMSWPKEAKRNNNQRLYRLAISPSGRRVIASGRTWTNDCLIWDRANHRTSLHQFTSNDLHFSDETSVYGFGANVAIVGYYVNAGNLGDNGEFSSTRYVGEVDDTDVGLPSMGTARSDYRACLAGPVGVAVMNFPSRSYTGSVVGHAERYTSILGTPVASPRFVGLDAAGSRMALATSSELFVLQAASGEADYFSKESNTSLARNALYRLMSGGQHLISRKPADPAVRSSLYELNWPQFPLAQKWQRMSCGIAVSADQTTLATLQCDTDDRLNAGSISTNPRLVVFRNLDPATAQPSADPPVVISPHSAAEIAQAARYEINRLLMLSPDGKNLLVGALSGSHAMAELYQRLRRNTPPYSFRKCRASQPRCRPRRRALPSGRQPRRKRHKTLFLGNC